MLAFCLAANVELVSLAELPTLDAFYSARPHAEFMRNDHRPGPNFYLSTESQLELWPGFLFSSRVSGVVSRDDPTPALVLTTPKGLEQIRRLGRFSGDLEETQAGLVYVPVGPIPGAR